MLCGECRGGSTESRGLVSVGGSTESGGLG